MRKRKRGVTSKTIAKMTRLARELEAANGLRISWGSAFWDGRHHFWFEAVPKDKSHNWLFCECGSADSVREALENFYNDMASLLQADLRFPKAERGDYILGMDDYKPARYHFDVEVYAHPGLHGRRVILPRAVPYNSRSKALAKISDKQ